jgi:hypothetical protein
MSVTPKAGVNMFFGDLVDESRTSYSFGLNANREVSRVLSVRLNFMGGEMKGEQISPTLNTPYASFENFYGEFTAGVTYRPLNHFLGYFKERSFQPYLLAQVGGVYFSATEFWGPASAGTSGSVPGEVWREISGLTPVVGMGGGLSYWITPLLSANIEISGNLPFSDKLDGHDVWYTSWEPRQDVHETDPYDFYYTATVGVTLLIGESQYRNDAKYNRASYIKTRKFLQPKSRNRQPNNRRRR